MYILVQLLLFTHSSTLCQLHFIWMSGFVLCWRQSFCPPSGCLCVVLCLASTRRWRLSDTGPSLTPGWRWTAWNSPGRNTVEHCSGWRTYPRSSIQTHTNRWRNSARFGYSLLDIGLDHIRKKDCLNSMNEVCGPDWLGICTCFCTKRITSEFHRIKQKMELLYLPLDGAIYCKIVVCDCVL